MIEIKTPVFPESILEGTISSWLKKPGDFIEEGDILVEIETDKIMMEVPSTVSGIIKKIIKKEGSIVFSKEIIAEINPQLKEKLNLNNNSEDIEPITSSLLLKNIQESSVNVQDKSLSPSMRRALKSNNFISSMNNIDNNTVNLSSDKKDNLREKRIPMSRIRQTIAKRLLQVQQSNAILTTFNEVDLKAVINLKKDYKDLFQKTYNTKLGFMSFFLKASIESLKRFPEINASIDCQDIVYHKFFDIGIAVGTDRGLVVPIIRNADQKSFSDIESEIINKADKARNGKLSLEEMQGGTFTITNGGSYGSMLSTPIINAPQSAILGMHNIVNRPVVINEKIVIRPIMYLALSYDHRIIDGSTSVKFLKNIKDCIEDPARILLQI